MVGPQDRPQKLPRYGRNLAEPTGRATWELNGAVSGLALSNDFNTVLTLSERWLKRTLERNPSVETLLGSSQQFALNAANSGALTWPLASGLTVATEPSTLVVNQFTGDFQANTLTSIGQTNHTFPPSTTVYVYWNGAVLDGPDQLGGQGTGNVGPVTSFDLYFDDTGGGPAAPPGSYITIGGVQTDATDVTANIGPVWSTSPVVSRDWTFDDSVLTVENNNDEIALRVQSNTTIAPGGFFTSNNSGAALQAEGTALTVGPAFTAGNLGPGQCITASKFAPSTGDVADFRQNGASGRALYILQNTGNNTDEGAEIQCFQTETCMVLDPTGGAALRINSQPFNPSLGIQGEMSLVGTDLKFNPDGAGPQCIWITEEGLLYEFATDIAGGSGTNTDFLVLSFNVPLFQNKRYLFNYRIHARHNLATVQRADIRIEVNGVPIPGLPGVPTKVNPASGISNDPIGQGVNYTHTAASGLLPVDLYFDTTPSGLGPTWTWEYVEVIVQGHYEL